MDFFDYLIVTYGYNEVILLSEISFNGYSEPWIKKKISTLCEIEKLIRYEKGIYYIPKDTLLGKSKIDRRKVIEKKYINNGKSDIGYYSGITFMNMIGLSNQMPNVLEIYTNNEHSRVREVLVGNQPVILRRARAEINSDNVATMSFLELMNYTDASFYDSSKKKIVSKYIENNNITRKAVTKYAPFFSDKAMRTLIESEIIFDVTP